MTDIVEIIARAICENTGGFAWPCAPEEMKSDCFGDSNAILRALEAAGYVIVPVEPTEAMTLAGVQTECGLGPYTLPDVIAASYRAMISAAQGDGE